MPENFQNFNILVAERLEKLGDSAIEGEIPRLPVANTSYSKISKKKPNKAESKSSTLLTHQSSLSHNESSTDVQ